MLLFVPYYFFIGSLMDSIVYESNSVYVIDKDKSTWTPDCANYFHQDLNCKYLKNIEGESGIVFDEDYSLFTAEISSLKPCKKCCNDDLTLVNRLKSVGLYYGVCFLIFLGIYKIK